MLYELPFVLEFRGEFFSFLGKYKVGQDSI